MAGDETTYSTLRAAELMGLSNFQKPRKPPRYAIGPSFAREMCSASTFFHLWEVVQIFQRESIFRSKISSGGNQFWGVHFNHDKPFPGREKENLFGVALPRLYTEPTKTDVHHTYKVWPEGKKKYSYCIPVERMHNKPVQINL